MTGRFEGKVGLISGGAKGIGKATVLRLVREGGRAAVLDLEPEDSEWVAKLRTDLGSNADRMFYVSADGTKEDAVKDAVRKINGTLGHIDVLVNNLGFGSNIVPLDQITMEFWSRFQAVNMTSAFLLTREIIPQMRERRDGRIVNVSSIVGRTVSEVANIAYHSAKSAMLGFTRSVAYEEGPNGIRSNAVAPGTTFTERVEKRYGELGAERRDALIAAYPLRRTARPEEIASVILFLASDDSSYVTGAVLDVNGGRFMA